ncbi:hypothetical protein J6590_063602 [Homalodisca vitripennis]|nr:hypothetical protein J6590_063602 [Homalodisca vitripennis]
MTEAYRKSAILFKEHPQRTALSVIGFNKGNCGPRLSLAARHGADRPTEGTRARVVRCSGQTLSLTTPGGSTGICQMDFRDVHFLVRVDKFMSGLCTVVARYRIATEIRQVWVRGWALVTDGLADGDPVSQLVQPSVAHDKAIQQRCM